MSTHLEVLEFGMRAIMDLIHPTGATVLWAPSQHPRSLTEPLLIELRRRGGGWLDGHDHSLQDPLTLATEIVVEPTGSSAVARFVVIYAGGRRWRTDVAAVSDAAFAAAIETTLEAAPGIDAAVAVAGSAVTITGNSLESLHGFRVEGNAGITSSTTTRADFVTGYDASQVEIQASATDRYLAGAHSALSSVLRKLRLPAIVALLDPLGISILDAGQVIDLTALSGPRFESRAALDLTIIQRSSSASVAKSAASVSGTLTDVDTGTVHTVGVTAP